MSTDSERDQSTDRLLTAALRPREAAASDSCLDAERLAAWADGQIWGQDAAGIETHLADCARCQALVAAFAATEPDPLAADAPAAAPAPVPIPFRPRRAIRWLVPAAATLAASLLIWLTVRHPSDVQPPTTTIAKADSGAPAAAPSASAPAPVADPAERSAAKAASAAAPARPGVTTAPVPGTSLAAPPPPPAALPAASPTPSPVAAPPPPTPTPAPTGAGAVQVTSAAELVRTQTPVATQSVSANVVQALPRADRAALGDLVTLPGGGVEFWPPQGTPSAAVVQVGAGAAGAGGRGGGGGGRAAGGAATVAQKTTPAATPASSVRWRIAPTGEVTKTTDGGNTWVPMAIDPPAVITSGAAPSASVCWLVGRGGLVLLSTDGARFTRITFPEAVDLQSVAAVDARQATVTAATGRAFTTADGGATWK